MGVAWAPAQAPSNMCRLLLLFSSIKSDYALVAPALAQNPGRQEKLARSRCQPRIRAGIPALAATPALEPSKLSPSAQLRFRANFASLADPSPALDPCLIFDITIGDLMLLADFKSKNMS